MRPRGLQWIVSTTAFVLGACTGGAAKEPAGKPDGVNLVFILLDTVRPDHLTPYGYAKDTTPFLASLAENGVVFERAYAPSTWTPSSMASIFTSLYVNQHGVLTGYLATQKALTHGENFSFNQIPSTTETAPEVLKRLGYRTFAVADNINISERLGFSRGFDRFWMHNGAGADAINAKLREWRAEVRSGKHFLYVHYNDAHAQLRGTGIYTKRKPWYDESVEPARENIEAYDSGLSYLDERVRELFELLEFEKDTLVVITADHGEEFGEHGGYEHTIKLYDELLRVPLIVYQPGRLARRRVSEPVSTLDLLPTFREAAGGKPSPFDQGVSLFKTIEGPPPAEPRTFFPMRFKEGRRKLFARKGVVRARWKYILTVPENTEELYDLEADPKERTNLASKLPQVVADLRGRLEAFESTAKVHKREFSGPAHISPEQAEQLRALGYIQ